MSMTRKISIPALITSIALLGGCGGGGDNGGTGMTSSGNNKTGTQTSNTSGGRSGANTGANAGTGTNTSTGDTVPTASYAYILESSSGTVNTAYGPDYSCVCILICVVGADGSLSA